MGSMGGEVGRKKAMWLYPKVMGFNPSERWGHSASYSNGFLYVFGGCCGGLHFSNVLVLNVDTMVWNTLATTGHGPGPRDSHAAVLVGHKMIVFGGTNGSKKVNDLHILDLRLKEWTQPECKGVPPTPRESHTATLVGNEKLVVFGGSGEGDSNYLNDVHVLDLKSMRWSSPEVKGDIPVPRDSHSAVAVGNKVFVYGGDCGDRYQGDIDMLDMDTLTWSRLAVQGSSPGVRAGHAAVNIGTKIYIIGGVGDKLYYNDVWVFDITTHSWSQLDICGQQPQGRFSHTAVITETDIAIYGGCGEDERPLNEFVVLQLGAEHPNGRYNISLCKIFRNHSNQEKRCPREAENSSVQNNMVESKQFGSGPMYRKRRRTGNPKSLEIESEPEEHSLSLSQHSSPSQSDQEQTPVKKTANSSTAASQPFHPFCRHQNLIPRNCHSQYVPEAQSEIKSTDVPRTSQNPSLPEQHNMVHASRHEARYPRAIQIPEDTGSSQNLIGAEIRGKVDGAFDSGYLMTAIVNGRIFRGVLFSPGPEVVLKGPSQIPGPQPHLITQIVGAQPYPRTQNRPSPALVRHPVQPHSMLPLPDPSQSFRQAQVLARMSPAIRASTPAKLLRSDLQGVDLTLGGPGSGV